MSDVHNTIDDLMLENRKFPPSAEFKHQALVADTSLYDEATEDYQGFWARQAADLLTWSTDWKTICEWELPFAKWFVGGQLNASYNCLDRHVEAGRGDKVAFYWEGEPGDSRVLTYSDLLDEVQRFANALKQLGVQRGDRINIYLPMIPEAAIAMLACARIGAAHSVVFGGFSAQSLSDRINDAEAKVLITADGGYRRGDVFPLKPAADEAIADDADHRACRRCSSRRQRRRDEGGSRPLVPRSDRGGRSGLPGRADGHRAAAVPALHQRHDRASRRASCTRAAAISPRSPSPTSTCSTCTPRPTCSGAPPTSAGSPGTATSSTARWPTAQPA